MAKSTGKQGTPGHKSNLMHRLWSVWNSFLSHPVDLNSQNLMHFTRFNQLDAFTCIHTRSHAFTRIHTHSH